MKTQEKDFHEKCPIFIDNINPIISSLIRENVNGKINKIGKIGLDFWNFQFFTFTFYKLKQRRFPTTALGTKSAPGGVHQAPSIKSNFGLRVEIF